MKHDVIVVGAGPAGATAARSLAVGGARVLLIDRSRFPRNKPCGGGITLRVLGRFPYLTAALPRISTHRIARLHLEGPSGGSVRIDAPRAAVLMVRRVEFDRLLVELAEEAGAKLVEGVEITNVGDRLGEVELKARDGRVFRAPLVVAADGANSVVARRLGLNEGWPRWSVALDMMEETPAAALECADPDTLWVYYGYGASHGYAYVFPKRDHVNVGIGCLLSYFRARVAMTPYQLQQQFVGMLTARGTLRGHSSREHFTPSLIPVGGPLRRTATERVLLAGDAGGFVNGFTAEGIYFAMVTGDLSARSILGGNPADYTDRWRREIGRELGDSVIVQRFVFRDPRRMDAVVEGARRYQAGAELLVKYATGELSYAAARRRLLWRFPTIALRVAADTFLGGLGVASSHPLSGSYLSSHK